MMEDRYQAVANDSSDTIQEYQLALSILNTINTFCTEQATETITKHLQGILYAQKLELLESHYQRMLSILNLLFAQSKEESQQKKINISITDLNSLVEKRKKYLHRWFSYLQFWSTKPWPYLNLLFLIVPLVVGIFVPPVGIAMLIFLAIYTTISLGDLGVQSATYWQWQDVPSPLEAPLSSNERIILDQDNLFKKIARPQEDFTNRRFNDVLYYGDIIGIAICIVGLIALIFPPVGITMLALSLLTGLAIFIGVAQLLVVWRQDKKEKMEHIYLETQKKILLDEISWLKPQNTLLDEKKTLERLDASSNSPQLTPKPSSWLDNPLSCHPISIKSLSPSPEKYPIRRWILNMMKWQSVETTREIEAITKTKLENPEKTHEPSSNHDPSQ